MVGASCNVDRIMRDLKQEVDNWGLEDTFKEKSTEYLLQVLVAIKEGRYPTRSHARVIEKVLRKRISPGTVRIWGEER